MNSSSQAVMRPRLRSPFDSALVSPAQAYDVAVVGLGPVGSVAVALLAQAGLRVYACDRMPIWPESRHVVSLDDDVLRVLEQIGVLGAILPQLQPLTASECYGVDGQLLQRTQLHPHASGSAGRPRSYVILQGQLERALRRALVHWPNVTLAAGRELTALHSTDCDVKLELCRFGQTGVVESIRVPWVVACDGAGSSVRQQLGIELEHIGFDESWLVVEALVRDGALAKLPQVTTQYCEPARPCRYSVGPGNHRRWELSLNSDEHPASANTEEHAWQLLSRWIGRDDAELAYVGHDCFRFSLAERWRSGRVFLAGDAAQVQPPLLGQGLCQGIRDVANLAWKLAAVQLRVVRGSAAERMLKSYNRERRDLSYNLLQRAQATCARFTERDEAKARERDAELLLEQRRLLYRGETVSEWLPQLEAGFLSRDPSPARGTKFPEARIRLAAGDAVSMDHHFGCGWRLVMDARLPFPAARSGIEVIPIGGRGFVESEAIVADWMREHDCHAVLLRPDHYVYGAAASSQMLRRLIDHWRWSLRDRKG